MTSTKEPHRRMSPTEETRRKISEKLKGRPLTEETKAKISDSLKSKPRSPPSAETREKWSKVRTGKTRPDMIGKAWNRGLTKETDPRVREYAEALSKVVRSKIQEGTFKPPVATEEFKEAASKRMLENPPSWKCRWFEVSGEKVQGTWERDLAEKMDDLGIPWTKRGSENRFWLYVLNDNTHRYKPDFYLPELNLQLEVKGFWWPGNREKMDLVLSSNGEARIKIIESDLFKLLLGVSSRQEFLDLLGQ